MRRTVIAGARHGEANGAALQQSRDAVFDGVFHQRLQQEDGNSALAAGLLDLFAELQAGAEAHLLDFQIAAGEGQFLAQGNGLSLPEAQAAAQEIGEADAHFAGARRRPGRSSAAMEWRLLKRKCGLICMRSAWISASRASAWASAACNRASREVSAESAA